MEILVFGAGGHAGKITTIAHEVGMKIMGYISTEKKGTIAHNSTVLGNVRDYKQLTTFHSLKTHIAIGDNATRHKIYKSLGALSENLITIVSKTSVISDNVLIMNGTAIIHNVVLQTNVNIGKCSLIDTGVIIEHDCNIGNFTNISPGTTICGGVTVHDRAIIGAGAIITEKITIGYDALVGAGAVVIDDIPDSCVAVGNPARVIKQRKFGDKYIR